MVARKLCAAVAALALGACSSNPFLDHYSGARYPEVPYATVVSEAPPSSQAIGSAEFTAAGGVGAEDALSAARAVGADAVAWGGSYDGTERGVAHRPVSVPVYGTSLYYGRCGYRYGTSFGYATVYEPYEYAVDYYRYRATFYRSAAADAPIRPAP
jgi:hypothetical protein